MKIIIRGCVAALCMGLLVGAQSVLAAQWRTGAAPNEQRWWYDNEDGTYLRNGWFWLDGNQDGIAECYYFDADGWMLADTVTPDGYTVNGNGAWVQNGQVMTRERNQTEEGVADMIAITVKVGNTSYPAWLYDNESGRTLVSRFPMTISMGELNGNEKYYYLPQDLPTNTEAIGNIHSGDLMLFGSDCLVLFYEDFRTSYRYTKLGYLEDPSGLAAALGHGNVNVTLEAR